MKRISKLLGMAMFASSLLFSCSKNNGGDDGNDGGNGGTGGIGGGTAGPMFSAVKTLMQGNCAIAGCHAGASPQNGLNFTNDNTIVAQKERIKVRAVDNAGTAAQMPPPPSAPLSTDDRKKITDWIAAGGKFTD